MEQVKTDLMSRTTDRDALDQQVAVLETQVSLLRNEIQNQTRKAEQYKSELDSVSSEHQALHMALRTGTPLAHCRSIVGVPGDLLGTPLDDGIALHITSPHAHAAAAGEAAREQHAREFPGQQNPTNQQISVNAQPPLVSSFLLGCCCFLHTCTHTSLPATAQVN